MKAEPNKAKLNHAYITAAKPKERAYLVWDLDQKGLALAVRPNGKKSFKVVYRNRATHQLRWFNIGDVQIVGLKEARETALDILNRANKGGDPQAERKAQYSSGTFEELVTRYV